MADRNQRPSSHHQTTRPTTALSTLLHNIQSHAPSHPQLIGILALVVSGSMLLLLTGITVTTIIMGFILFLPLIIISSPIWFPIGAALFLLIGGVLAAGGTLAGSVAVVSWLYRYFRGMHPPGSDQVDYARSRIYDTASHVKDYAREYGGYLHSRAKDAAPGA